MKLNIQSAVKDDANVRSYDLLSQEGFNELTRDFPQLQESMMKHTDLRLIGKDMASYLNRHHVNAWISEE